MIASSILDFAWIDAVDHQPNQPVMIIYEGVSMYLSEADNRALLEQLERRFGFAHVVFDVLNRKVANRTRRHDTVSKTSAQFQWGIDRSRELETWNPNFVLKEEQFYLQHFLDYPQRLPTTWRVISQLLPALPMALFKNSGRIVRLQLGPEPI
ncbi:hypothetical protein C1752_03448 [Acaryochloris thomasi RCC1774]|uniref:Uncharacterized protein n=1 Tax=Acaryochloris thomasi RCC1774 TaxID=1764569 RepID=A0A2W1JP11_9CYAN|nr:hypothetical protein [Acaryochloris thomasi]PZD72612.1 hypothetical protein C1752_03448 [Acaryochloris thomasi RCC1774]